ncbi:phosphopantetheine-binding protein [Ruminiclostridium papyrosolvens DSM 2782]|uniref:Phosphopantetheine-binding protein n=1 Tax=Ruminiclostridium papyrosolvens DSM 2782 TaxID=588581 RepID=F1TC25_9FIRM|nr:acyl carrier protein [Ruminiclostridium papyrosolvens]EGD47940.1 phosphopantetheine-binding protein [Ruminiclostridium papyrosolvens DSM 2782]WES35168.1 acyl carrier protein [Ruminiclostridium papyrosolvens DSM 2782]
MQKQEIESKVCEVVSRVAQFNNENVVADSDLRDNYGVDSIVLVELLVEIEDIFGITFDSSSLTYETFSTVNSITDYVDNILNS